MYFTVTGLPADLNYSNLTSQGFAGGTLTIQGTPSAADIGVHQVQITAQNGVGVMARQTLTLNILTLTGPAPASGSPCNGNYNGTFNGSVTVWAGQNCAFFGGGVNGNVTVSGGHLALTNATVTRNYGDPGRGRFLDQHHQHFRKPGDPECRLGSDGQPDLRGQGDGEPERQHQRAADLYRFHRESVPGK
jgi:hypothetical protein